MVVAVSVLRDALKSSTNATLLRTIENSRARFAAARDGSPTQAVESNRIEAASDILAARGYYDGVPTGDNDPSGFVNKKFYGGLLVLGLVVSVWYYKGGV